MFRAMCRLIKGLKTRNEELCRDFAPMLKRNGISLPELNMNTDAENVPYHWCHAENMVSILAFSESADGAVPNFDDEGWRSSVASAQDMRDQMKGLNMKIDARIKALRMVEEIRGESGKVRREWDAV